MASIERYHKRRPLNYDCSVYVLIRPTNLVLEEHFFCILSVLTRLVGLISTKTIKHFCFGAIYAISLWLRRATVFRDVMQRFHERFLSGKRCVTSRKTAAKEISGCAVCLDRLSFGLVAPLVEHCTGIAELRFRVPFQA